MLRSLLARVTCCALLTISPPAVATAATPGSGCEDGPCATDNPNVDCWYSGQWYHKKCATTCPPG